MERLWIPFFFSVSTISYSCYPPLAIPWHIFRFPGKFILFTKQEQETTHSLSHSPSTREVQITHSLSPPLLNHEQIQFYFGYYFNLNVNTPFNCSTSSVPFPSFHKQNTDPCGWSLGVPLPVQVDPRRVVSECKRRRRTREWLLSVGWEWFS